MLLSLSGSNCVMQEPNMLVACNIINNSVQVILLSPCFSRWLCVFGNESRLATGSPGFGPQDVLKEYGHMLLQTSFVRKRISGHDLEVPLG